MSPPHLADAPEAANLSRRRVASEGSETANQELFFLTRALSGLEGGGLASLREQGICMRAGMKEGARRGIFFKEQGRPGAHGWKNKVNALAAAAAAVADRPLTAERSVPPVHDNYVSRSNERVIITRRPSLWRA